MSAGRKTLNLSESGGRLKCRAQPPGAAQCGYIPEIIKKFHFWEKSKESELYQNARW